jgi:hypothetical protein
MEHGAEDICFQKANILRSRQDYVRFGFNRDVSIAVLPGIIKNIAGPGDLGFLRRDREVTDDRTLRIDLSGRPGLVRRL